MDNKLHITSDKERERFKALLQQQAGKDQLAALEGLAQFEMKKKRIEEALSTQTAELAQTHRVLAEKDRLLAIFNRIGRSVLSSIDMDEVLDNLTFQVLEAGLFRSFMVALVDEQSQIPRIVRPFTRQGPSGVKPQALRQRVADEAAIQAACSGEMQIVESAGQLSKHGQQDNKRACQFFFYIPVKRSGQVLAILGTDCSPQERDMVQSRISTMGPLFDQIAIALEHAKANRRLEEARLHLIQTDKMASLGQLAAGVAHEINNPVGFVGSNITTLQDYIAVFKRLLKEYKGLADWVRRYHPDGSKELLDCIDTIQQSGELDFIHNDIDQLLSESAGGLNQVIDIVQGLKNFARDEGLELRETDINLSMEETIRIVWNELKYKCEIHKDLGDIPLFRSYPGQLKQVFMNLLTNAAHSIPERGDIWIKTWVDGTHLKVSVRDNGTGMSSAVQERIFEPFYTTKPAGHGTGLGLAICHGIIKAHQGRIEVHSTKNDGTQFVLEIPMDL